MSLGQRLFQASYVTFTDIAICFQVDWDSRTLGVFASKGAFPLKKVSKLVTNNSTQLGATGQGDFHFGVLKVLEYNTALCTSLNRPCFSYRSQTPTTLPRSKAMLCIEASRREHLRGYITRACLWRAPQGGLALAMEAWFQRFDHQTGLISFLPLYSRFI
jgi:hypothetical protein